VARGDTQRKGRERRVMTRMCGRAAREWQAVVEYGGFLSRRKVTADLRAVGVMGKIPRYMDGKWVANLDLNDFISIWENQIEHVRSSQRGTVKSFQEQSRPKIQWRSGQKSLPLLSE
jgi:hypothetical protein